MPSPTTTLDLAAYVSSTPGRAWSGSSWMGGGFNERREVRHVADRAAFTLLLDPETALNQAPSLGLGGVDTDIGLAGDVLDCLEAGTVATDMVEHRMRDSYA
jgi:hypothetical protein